MLTDKFEQHLQCCCARVATGWPFDFEDVGEVTKNLCGLRPRHHRVKVKKIRSPCKALLHERSVLVDP